MNPKNVIEKNRKKIDRINEKIIYLIAERNKLVKEIGLAKKKLGMKVVDRKREKEVLENSRKIAEKMKVDPKIAEKIMKILIEYARKIQGAKK
ncbi:MAG: chorismate mutase [Candidatus Aenigmatarchaeota archaeon]